MVVQHFLVRKADTYHVLPQQVQLVALEPGDLVPEAPALGANDHAGARALARLALLSLGRAHALQARVAVGVDRVVELELAVERAVVALRNDALRLWLLRLAPLAKLHTFEARPRPVRPLDLAAGSRRAVERGRFSLVVDLALYGRQAAAVRVVRRRDAAVVAAQARAVALRIPVVAENAFKVQIYDKLT